MRQAMSLIGNRKAPKHTPRFVCAKAGSPTGGDAYGDGTLIVPDRETKMSLAREGAFREIGTEHSPILECREGKRYHQDGKVCEMQNAQTYFGILRERGKRGFPLERVYRQLFNRELYLKAYGRIYRNAGAMTHGITDETADGMSLEKIDTIIDALRQ